MNIILNKSNILSFNFLNDLLITIFLLLKKTRSLFLNVVIISFLCVYVTFILIFDMFDMLDMSLYLY